jgi:hypothetical protein
MSKRLLFSLVCLLCLAAVGRAQENSSAVPAATDNSTVPDKEESPWHFSPKQKFTVGNQQYKGSDTAIYLDMPLGFSVNADANLYESNTSSLTPTYTIGAGASWDQASLKASYAISTLANDESSTAVDVGGSMFTVSKDFKTTLSADVNATFDAQYLRIVSPTVKNVRVGSSFTDRIDITELTPTIGLKQRFWSTRVTVDLSDTKYNQDLTTLANQIARHPHLAAAYSGLGGLIDGFPHYYYRFGLYQDFDAVPVTLWATYQDIHLMPVPGGGGYVDNYAFGVDYDLPKDVTLSFSYNYIRQTTQGPQDLYSLSIMAMF